MLNAKSTFTDHRLPVRPVMIGRFHFQPQRRILPDVRCDLVWIDEKLMFSGPITQARLPPRAGKIVAVASFNALVVKRWLRVPLRLLVDEFVSVSDVAPDLERPLADHFAADATAIVLPAMAQPDSFHDDARLACALRKLREGRSVQAASLPCACPPGN